MADKYIIRVTAGSNYDINSHVVVPVNSHETVNISNDHIDAELNVRVQNYTGLPRESPRTSPYFSLEPHAKNADQYSIAIRFTLKQPNRSRRKSPSSGSGTRPPPQNQAGNGPTPDHEEPGAADEDEDGADASPTSETGVSGHDLQFGNDLDHPIRDRIPPGFNYALNIVKWWIDPGLDGDPYADTPHLYGPGLSSFNTVHVGAGGHDAEKGGLYFEEGGDEDGLRVRRAIGAPDAAAERRKWALRDQSKRAWTFEHGRTYCVDFFNPYLDFAGLAVRLPGFALPVLKYWDGQGLRYVLRNRATGDAYLVIVFSLHLKEDVNEDGSLKPAALKTGQGDPDVAMEKADRVDEGSGEVKGDEEGERGNSDDVD